MNLMERNSTKFIIGKYRIKIIETIKLFPVKTSMPVSIFP